MTSLLSKCPHCGAPLDSRFCSYCKLTIPSPQGSKESKKQDREEAAVARDTELREQLALLDTQFRPTWRRRRALRA